MTNDTRPPVAPIEGHYAMLRNGVLDLIERYNHEGQDTVYRSVNLNYKWFESGIPLWNDPQYDIIATISPEAMALAAPGDYTVMPTKLAEALNALVPLASAVLDHADQHCRWFDISTAPDEEGLSFLVSIEIRNPSTIWREVHVIHLNEDGEIHTDCHQGWSLGDYTHWAPLPPPPSNPPLPAVFTELGLALEKIKGAG